MSWWAKSLGPSDLAQVSKCGTWLEFGAVINLKMNLLNKMDTLYRHLKCNCQCTLWTSDAASPINWLSGPIFMLCKWTFNEIAECILVETSNCLHWLCVQMFRENNSPSRPLNDAPNGPGSLLEWKYFGWKIWQRWRNIWRWNCDWLKVFNHQWLKVPCLLLKGERHLLVKVAKWKIKMTVDMSVWLVKRKWFLFPFLFLVCSEK